MKKNVLMATVIAVCALSAALAFGIRKKITNLQDNKSLSAQAPLREKARQKGRYEAVVRPLETTRYDDIKSLSMASPLIVTGLVQQQKSFVPATNDRLIVTGHQLLVQEVLKGRVKTGDIITVETLGGSVQFEDGSTAELKTPEIFKDPELAKSYVMFLRPHKDAYRLVGGPQGLFEITAMGTIKPQVPADDTLMRAYSETRLDKFLRSITKVTAPANP